MRVVLDSTTFIADLQLKGPLFRVLRDAVDKAGYTLHVPVVVVEEVQNKYRERLRKAVDDLGSKYDDLARLGVVAKAPDYDEAWIVAQSDLYADHLKRWLRDSHADLLPIPDLTHETLVRQELQRRRPFSEKGTGYRDALIWNTVLELADTAGDPILFVSGNTRDFAGSGGELHGDLKGDLVARGLASERVRLVVGLDELVDKFIKSDLESLDAIRDALLASTYAALDIAAELKRVIPELIVDRRWRGRDLGLPDDVDEGRVVDVDEIAEIDVTDVLKLPDGELFIEVEAAVTCDVEFEAYRVERVLVGRHHDMDDFDTYKHRVTEATERTLRVALQMTFDPEAQEITSTDVDFIEALW